MQTKAQLTAERIGEIVRYAVFNIKPKDRIKLSEGLVAELLEKFGYRWLGQDVYCNRWYHVAKWTDDSETCSYGVGHAQNLKDAIKIAYQDGGLRI